MGFKAELWESNYDHFVPEVLSTSAVASEAKLLKWFLDHFAPGDLSASEKTPRRAGMAERNWEPV